METDNPPGVEEIKESLGRWHTERLIELWVANDREKYRAEHFSALKELLQQRGVRVSRPGQLVRYQGQEFVPPPQPVSPPSPPEVESGPLPEDETLVTVAACEDLSRADLLKSRLEAEGISVFLLGETHVNLLWLHSRAIGGIRVQVRKSQAGQAGEIMRLLEGKRLEIEEESRPVRCPRCGSTRVKSRKIGWKVAFLSFFLCQLPLPFRKNLAVCESCGYKWNRWEKLSDQARESDPDEGWACTDCGAPLAEESRVCPRCGVDVREARE